MDEFVADAHALIWYFTDSKNLGPNATRAFQDADRGEAIIHVPAIVLAEMYYANVKTGYPIDFAEAYRQLESAPSSHLPHSNPKMSSTSIATLLFLKCTTA